MSTIMQRIADRIADPVERDLWLAHQRAGNELDAANDGALHHAMNRAAADAACRAIDWEYARSGRALTEYRAAKKEGVK